MSLVKRIYVDGETVIIAQNLNDIQDAIIENETDIEGKVDTNQGTANEGKAMVVGSDGNLSPEDITIEVDPTLTQEGEAADAKATGDAIRSIEDITGDGQLVGFTATDLTGAANELKGDTSELKNTLNHKADVIYDTASGDIASFPDGADGLPVKDLTVGIEPVQYLHGQANPWPAGGGKNYCKLNESAVTVREVTATPQTDSAGNIVAVNVNGTATGGNAWMELGSFLLGAGSYIMNGCPSGGSGTTYRLALVDSNGQNAKLDSGNGISFTLDASGTWRVQIVVYNEATVSNVKFYPMIRLASVSDATFEPYSNICPISGWTGANVTRTGKNLVEDVFENGNINASGIIVENQSSYDLQIAKVKKGITYTITSDELFVGGFYTSKPTSGSQTYNQSRWADAPKTFVAPIDGYVAFRTSHDYATPQMEVGSTATTYETYAGTTIPISWQSSAGTVYGGALDVTTGVLTVDRAMVDMGTLAWIRSSGDGFFAFSGDLGYYRTFTQYTIPNFKCSIYITENWAVINEGEQSDFSLHALVYDGGQQIRVYDSRYSDAASFISGVSGQTIVYELAQPQTYQLTPTEVATLLGQNNIWVDCGPSTVEYPCDTKTYVDNGIGEVNNALNSTQGMIATVEPTSTASKNYAVGELLVYNGTLYRVASPISSGGTFTPGTNIVATTVEAEIDTQEALINSNHSELYNWLLPMLVMDSDSLGEDQTYATTSRIVKRKKNHITIKYASDSTTYLDFSVIGVDIGIYSKTDLNTYLTLPKTDNADLFLVLKYNEVSKGGSSINTNTYRIRTWDGNLEHDEITKNYRPAGSGTITSTSGILIINISADLPEAITNGRIAFMVYSRNAKLEGDYYINVLALPKLPIST